MVDAKEVYITHLLYSCNRLNCIFGGNTLDLKKIISLVLLLFIVCSFSEDHPYYNLRYFPWAPCIVRDFKYLIAIVRR